MNKMAKTHKKANLNLHKTKPKPTLYFNNYSCVWNTYHCIQLSYTTLHRTIPI